MFFYNSFFILSLIVCNIQKNILPHVPEHYVVIFVYISVNYDLVSLQELTQVSSVIELRISTFRSGLDCVK